VCILIGGLVLLSQTDQSHQYVKNIIEKRLNSIPNLHVKLGDIRGTIISSMEINDIEMKIAGEDFIKIEKLSTNYSVPLLYSIISKKKLYLSHTDIYGLRLLLEKDSGGEWNFKKLKNEDGIATGLEQEKISLVLANNKIRNSHVSISDHTRDKTWEFDFVEESDFSIKIVELTKKIELDAKDINFDYLSPRIRIRNLRGKIDIASWNCVFKDAEFKVENIPLRGNGTVKNLREPEFDMTVYLDGVGINGKGELNLQAKTKVKMYSVDNMVGTMDVSARDSLLNSHQLWTDFEPIRINGTKAHIEGTLGSGFGESRLTGNVNFEKWLAKGEKNWFDFEINLNNANTDELTEILNPSSYPLKLGDSSKVNSNLRVSGSWTNKEIYSLLIESDHIDLTDGEQSSLSVGGSLTLKNDITNFDLRSEANRFKLNLNFPYMMIDSYVDGTSSFQGTIPRKSKLFEDINLYINADLRTTEFYGITNIDSKINASIEEEILTVNGLDILSDQFSLSAKKTAVRQKNINCTFEFATQNLDFLSDITESIPPLSGKISSSGKISGSVFALVIEATSNLRNFAYKENFIANDMSVRSSTRIDLRNKPRISLDVNLHGKQARVLGNYLDVIEAKLQGTEIETKIETLSSRKDGSFVSSKLKVSNFLEKEKKIEVTYLEGLLDKIQFRSKGNMFAEISPERKKLQGDEFVYGEGKLTDFLGEINQQQKTIDLRATIVNFNSLIISKALNFKNDLEGIFNGQVRISGPFTSPFVRAEVKSDGLFYKISEARKMKINLQGENGKLSFDFISSMDQGKSLSLRGDLMLPENAQSPLEAITESSLDLKLSSDRYRLDLFKIFSNSIEKIDGDFSSHQLSLQGTFSKPWIKGYLEINNMSFSLSQLKNDLFTQYAGLSFNGRTVTLPRTELRSKDGKAYMKGKMNLSGLNFLAYLEMKKIRFNPHSIETDISGHLKIEKKDEFLSVTGDTQVTAGRIRLYPGRIKNIKDINLIEKKKKTAREFSLEEENQAGFYKEKTKIDISVDIFSGTWIKTREAKLNTSGKLKLRKKLGEDLKLQGNIVSSEGYYTVFGKLFDIEDSTLNFTGEPNNPNLNIKAYYDAGDIDVYANVTGDLMEPDLSMSSSSELEDIDIISYIVFGAPSNRLQNRQRDFLGKFATAVAAGGISQLLSSEIGLGLLSIQEGDQGLEDSILKIGFYVTKDILVIYERSPSATSIDQTTRMRNKLNLEWKLNRSFSVESQMGGENPGVDFFYNFNF